MNKIPTIIPARYYKTVELFQFIQRLILRERNEV